MELVFIVALLIALAVLAPRFGYDSRDRFQSAEERQAATAWSGSPSNTQGGLPW